MCGAFLLFLSGFIYFTLYYLRWCGAHSQLVLFQMAKPYTNQRAKQNCSESAKRPVKLSERKFKRRNGKKVSCNKKKSYEKKIIATMNNRNTPRNGTHLPSCEWPKKKRIWNAKYSAEHNRSSCKNRTHTKLSMFLSSSSSACTVGAMNG